MRYEIRESSIDIYWHNPPMRHTQTRRNRVQTVFDIAVLCETAKKTRNSFYVIKFNDLNIFKTISFIESLKKLLHAAELRAQQTHTNTLMKRVISLEIIFNAF